MFENSIVKRRVQSILFNGIKVTSMVGLAGPNPEDYVEIIKQHADKINLCDYEPSRKYVTKNSLIGMYQLVKPKWVDADFCSSWITNRLDTWYLYKSLKETGGILTVTFSTHTGYKDAQMFEALKEIFGVDLSKAEKEECITFPKLGGKEYIHIYEPVDNITMIKYRDSGDNMICLKVIVASSTSEKPVLENKKHKGLVSKTKVTEAPKVIMPIKVSKKTQALMDMFNSKYEQDTASMVYLEDIAKEIGTGSISAGKILKYLNIPKKIGTHGRKAYFVRHK